MGDGLAVHGHALEVGELDRRGVEYLALQRHSPLGDHALDLAPARHARAREQLGDTIALGR